MDLSRVRVPRRRPVTVAVAAAGAVCLAGVVAPGAGAASGASETAASNLRAADPPVEVDKGQTNADNPLVPKGATWTEHYFDSPQAGAPTPVELHADVLRPSHLPADAKTPVIMSVSSYLSHAGQASVEQTATGPSQRFRDLIDGASLMERGYTVVLVDLRGFGGSTGCLDWLGRGEQADIKRSVEWAASQPWSSGKVGTYGKSYDASTGLWANNLRPQGLAAVVAQEPLWNGYNYYYSNEVARPNHTATPAAYNNIATMPPTAGDTDRYKRNAAYEKTHPQCLSNNKAGGLNTKPTDPYWVERDAITAATGSTTPIFFLQGFTESNTKPEQMQEFLENHKGVERGWLGPWEHVRGNETDANGRLLMGRAGFFDETMRFFDKHLKGIEPSVVDPNYAIQDSFGRWRAQDTWPGSASTMTTQLGSGKYVDSGSPTVMSTPAAAGHVDQLLTSSLSTNLSALKSAERQLATPSTYTVYSRPVTRETRLTATPSITLRTVGNGEVLVRLHDYNPKTGKAVRINENVARLKAGSTSFDLKSMDWTIKTGNQLAVTIGTIGSRSGWVSKPSRQVVTVNSADLTWSSQRTTNDVPTQGHKSAYLDDYIRRNTVTLPAGSSGTFRVPPPR